MNSKTAFLILFTFLLLNCEVKFDRNVRVETAGKVIDENSEPMPNVFVGVYTEAGRSSGFYPYPSERREYLLGSSKSDENGNFSVTSLFDSDRDFFIFVDGEASHTSYIYSANTYAFEPANYVFNLEEVQLKMKSIVNVIITRSSPSGTTLELVINYENPFCEEVFVDGVLDEDSSNCFRTESIFRTLDNDNPDLTWSFGSFVTGTIQFIYTINGGSQTTETFFINQENYDINFSY